MRPAAAPTARADTGVTPHDDSARLRRAAGQLTGVFAQQLFKAMRETVPRGEGVVDGGSGEEMFTGMLDEHLAGAAGGGRGAGATWTRSLAEAVHRQLAARGAPPAAPPAAPPSDVTAAPARASLGQPLPR